MTEKISGPAVSPGGMVTGQIDTCITKVDCKKPQGVLPYQEVGGGGLDLASSLEAKFGARFSQVYQIRGKIWGVLSLQDAKIGKESKFWGHLGLYLKFKRQNLGYLSPICLGYLSPINLGLRPEFQRQNLGPSPPDLLIWKYPLWAKSLKTNRVQLYKSRWQKA